MESCNGGIFVSHTGKIQMFAKNTFKCFFDIHSSHIAPIMISRQILDLGDFQHIGQKGCLAQVLRKFLIYKSVPNQHLLHVITAPRFCGHLMSVAWLRSGRKSDGTLTPSRKQLAPRGATSPWGPQNTEYKILWHPHPVIDES